MYKFVAVAMPSESHSKHFICFFKSHQVVRLQAGICQLIPFLYNNTLCYIFFENHNDDDWNNPRGRHSHDEGT